MLPLTFRKYATKNYNKNPDNTNEFLNAVDRLRKSEYGNTLHGVIIIQIVKYFQFFDVTHSFATLYNFAFIGPFLLFVVSESASAVFFFQIIGQLQGVEGFRRISQRSIQ